MLESCALKCALNLVIYVTDYIHIVCERNIHIYIFLVCLCIAHVCCDSPGPGCLDHASNPRVSTAVTSRHDWFLQELCIHTHQSLWSFLQRAKCPEDIKPLINLTCDQAFFLPYKELHVKTVVCFYFWNTARVILWTEGFLPLNSQEYRDTKNHVGKGLSVPQTTGVYLCSRGCTVRLNWEMLQLGAGLNVPTCSFIDQKYY